MAYSFDDLARDVASEELTRRKALGRLGTALGAVLVPLAAAEGAQAKKPVFCGRGTDKIKCPPGH